MVSFPLPSAASSRWGEGQGKGLHFLSRVRTLAPRCGIVLMTGHVTDALVKAAMSLGASEVLAKPFGAEELDGGA